MTDLNTSISELDISIETYWFDKLIQPKELVSDETSTIPTNMEVMQAYYYLKQNKKLIPTKISIEWHLANIVVKIWDNENIDHLKPLAVYKKIVKDEIKIV